VQKLHLLTCDGYSLVTGTRYYVFNVRGIPPFQLQYVLWGYADPPEILE